MDPTTPVTQWSLSDAGVQRATRLAQLGWAPSVADLLTAYVSRGAVGRAPSRAGRGDGRT